jgi:hypothetical protein
MDLPVHQYVTIDAGTISKDRQEGVWFAIQPNIGGIYGGHVLLANGALYRNIPLCSLRLSTDLPVKATEWAPEDLQWWNCYSEDVKVHEYGYLRGLTTLSRAQNHGEIGSYRGRYLFTIIPRNDPYSRHLDQAKEFVVSAITTAIPDEVNDWHGRIAIRATNELIFLDKSLGPIPHIWPSGLTRQHSIPSVE